MMQETQRKYTKPSYSIKDLRGDPKVRWKDDVKNDTRRMGMKWRKVAQGRVGWRCLFFLDSRSTPEEEDIAIFSTSL
jgi:hypothetical protein